MHNAPRVNERVWHIELVGPFHEERTSFRIKESKTLVDGNLRCIRFDLRKVGAHGAIQHEVAAESKSCVAAEVGCVAVVPAFIVGFTAWRTSGAVGDFGLQREVESVFHTMHSFQPTLL